MNSSHRDLLQAEIDRLKLQIKGLRELLDECVKQNQDYRDRNKELENKVRSMILELQKYKMPRR